MGADMRAFDPIVLCCIEFALGLAAALATAAALVASRLARHLGMTFAAGGTALLYLSGGLNAVSAFQAAIEQGIRTMPAVSMGLIAGLSLAAVVSAVLPTRTA